MSDSFILVQGTSQKLDTQQVTTGVGAVERQVGVIGDPSTAAMARIGANPIANSLAVNISTDQVVPVQSMVPATDNGVSTFHLIGLATTNPSLVKATPGRLVYAIAYNKSNAFKKVAFHNTASAPVAGTTPIKINLVIPPNSSAKLDLPECGIYFSSGIALTTVTGLADNSAAAIGAGEVSLDLLYK